MKSLVRQLRLILGAEDLEVESLSSFRLLILAGYNGRASRQGWSHQDLIPSLQ